MRIEEKGIVITFGTSDAPAPKGEIPAANPVSAMACVEHAAGSAATAEVPLKLVYRVNGGQSQSVATERLWKSPRGKGWYYRAYIPARNPGDRVDYAFCLSSQVGDPAYNEGTSFGSFVVAPANEVKASSPEVIVKTKAT